MKTKRKQVKTIQAFLDYLNELGLTVYGQSMDESGCEYPSLMDYDATMIAIRRQHVGRGTIHSAEDRY